MIGALDACLCLLALQGLVGGSSCTLPSAQLPTCLGAYLVSRRQLAEQPQAKPTLSRARAQVQDGARECGRVLAVWADWHDDSLLMMMLIDVRRADGEG